MKVTVNAGELATALALAASLSNRPQVIAALGALHIKVGDDAIALTANVLDHAITLTLPATVESAGEVAISASRLAGVTATFPATAMVEISCDEIAPVAQVRCGRSRFKFPIMPLEQLPAVPRLVEETGRVNLAREEALTLMRPAFAAAKKDARYYLCGLLLHDSGSSLVGVSTDGYRLALATIPNAAGLSPDFHLNLPASTVKIVNKILADKTSERVVLCCSDTLFAIETAKISFVSKLIDGKFPDYKRVLPEPSGNNVVVDRDELLLALERAQAALEDQQHVIGLEWNAGAAALKLFYGDIIDDTVAAESTGAVDTSTKIDLLAEVLEKAFAGKRVKLDILNSGTPISITDPDDADLLALSMPCKLPPAAVHNASELTASE